MSAPIDDGGPAFPCQPLDGQGMPCNAAQDGMTLRDYFAAAALQGQLSCVETINAINKANVTGKEVAGSCYDWADAMLAARKEKP